MIRKIIESYDCLSSVGDFRKNLDLPVGDILSVSDDGIFASFFADVIILFIFQAEIGETHQEFLQIEQISHFEAFAHRLLTPNDLFKWAARINDILFDYGNAISRPTTALCRQIVFEVCCQHYC